MDYLLCIPARETNTRENCEKIHNVLARMSDAYKLRIVPEAVKNKQFPCPAYYKKYRIYKPVKERDTNGEAYLEKEEEEMILNSCKTEEEQELMKSCIYAYQYSAAIVLKSFREKEKKNRAQVRPLSERTQASKGPGAERSAGRERERGVRISSAEGAVDRRDVNRAASENEKKEERPVAGKRERSERHPARRGERAEAMKLKPQKRESLASESQKYKEPKAGAIASEAQNVELSRGGLPLRDHVETDGLPPFRESASQVTAQPMQRKGYAPMERKSAVPSQEADTQI